MDREMSKRNNDDRETTNRYTDICIYILLFYITVTTNHLHFPLNFLSSGKFIAIEPYKLLKMPSYINVNVCTKEK